MSEILESNILIKTQYRGRSHGNGSAGFPAPADLLMSNYSVYETLHFSRKSSSRVSTRQHVKLLACCFLFS
jgi:hypothetical protein